MLSQSKAQEALLRLRKRLYRARDQAVGKDRDVSEKHSLYSRFQEIDGKLDALKDHFPRVKGWEESLAAKFTSLEHSMYAFLAQSKNRVNGPDTEDLLGQLEKAIQVLNKDVILQSEALRLPAVKEPGFGSAVLLRYQHDEEEKSTRKMSQEWLSRGVEKKILASAAMADLRASYDNLDSLDLKLCCLFLSVFPERKVIKKRPLIYWWIGEGLITHAGDKTDEEAGESIFAKLISLGLIEPYHDNPVKPSPIVTACTVHPWVRYMLVWLANEASLFDFDRCTVATCLQSRRACLTSLDQDASNSLCSQRLKEGNLSSVFNVSQRYLDFDADWLPKLRKIVVLQLGRWHHSPEHHIEVADEKFLNGFAAQMHLKYLSLRGISRITVIPKSIVELLSLEILDLKACHNLEKLPPDIGPLRRLTHLIVSDCPLLESMPKGIERLSNLQVLKGFMIRDSKQTPCKVADLVELTALRRLGIYIGNEARDQDSELTKRELAELKKIKSLRCLTISWGVKYPAPAAVIGLSFPPNLEKLSLRGFPRTERQTSTEPMTKGKEAQGDPREQHPTELSMKKENPAQSPETRRPRPSLARIYSGLKTRAKRKEFPADMEDNVPQRSLKELKPSNMRNLKRLYIRGGELGSLNHEENWVWAVEILQLKYLSNFKIERDKLMAEFPHLTYLDVKCDAVMEHKNSEDIKYKEDFVLTKREIEEERRTRSKVNN